MTIAQLVKAMEEPATQDLRGYRLLPIVFEAIGRPKQPALRKALNTLRAWHDAGAHRRDLDRDGVYEENRAVELMDAWWPQLVTAEFKGALGKKAFERLEGMLSLGSYTGGSPREPDFESGWWGYVSKDLRDLFGSRAKAPFSRIYCGKGSKKRCRLALQRSLGRALKATAAQMYGGGDGSCAASLQPSCFDQNRPRVTSGVELGPFPFQNRPTFQQVVTLTQKLPR
jgi:hypothetical protein